MKYCRNVEENTSKTASVGRIIISWEFNELKVVKIRLIRYQTKRMLFIWSDPKLNGLA